ncbi:MAG: DUF2520 domain-containing protein [Chitinophagaceae bacterium]|nr:DUF2520 domain-containing protein [Chitinophagaceae bacterium]
MIVTIIGTGNVASVLSKLIFQKGHTIAQIFGRNLNNATTLAKAVNAQPVTAIKDITKGADIYIMAVSDKAIEEISTNWQLNDKIIVHTAGAINKSVLQHISLNYGVLYPIQSLKSNMSLETTIPFLIDGNNDNTLSVLKTFAESLSTFVNYGNDEQRLQLHIAAVFANNFVNFMYAQSANICSANKINFELLYPLIEATANNIKTQQPKELFTGPAIRKDEITIAKHLNALQNEPKLLEQYQTLTKWLMEN